MVQTRHSAGASNEDSPEAILLTSRRSRRAVHRQRKERVVIVSESEEEDDMPVTRSRRRPPQDLDSSASQESSSSPPRPRRSRGRNERHQQVENDMLEDMDEEPRCHSTRRTHQSPGYDDHTPGMVNGDVGSGIRRSTRQRRGIYSTLNDSLISSHLLTGGLDLPSGKQSSSRRHQRSELEQLKSSFPEVQLDDKLDMYTRVKRERKHVERDMYGMPVKADDDSEEDSESEEEAEETEEDTSSDEDEEEEEEEEEEARTSYSLRKHKPITQRFEVPMEEPVRRKRQTVDMFDSPVKRRRDKHLRSPHSPYQRRRRRTFHRSSSTSSSGSDDEEKFERRKAKSMARARMRCLPMNMLPDDVAGGVIRDRSKIGSSLADVDPMNIDRSVTFDSVGGLGKHIQSLKEMVIFPLLYPEVFQRFNITPPRGCLFYGPPGTGKTLVARALANECSQGDKRVAFFMRKGADCLSKWVGESERQLRLLFDQAYTMRPSIIFFDEIDGLAPVRSSRQDQIHSSIVSTLLALMDGLDSRGEIVVIGATNRIDSIDPALRRPGRFDREFLFGLPDQEARHSILRIHTKEWTPRLSDAFLSEAAEKCVGYCGADLKSLCTEAALFALRRRYPQIYSSKEKLQLDVSSINVSAKDFHQAMQNITPASQRSVVSPGHALGGTIQMLLQGMLDSILGLLQKSFPPALAQAAANPTTGGTDGDPVAEILENDSYSDDEGPCIFDTPQNRRRRKQDDSGRFLNFALSACQRAATHRPRLLITGQPDMGQTAHLAPAVVHHLESLPVYTMDLPALYAVSVKTPEESCAQIFREARRTSPSVIYAPHIDQWWDIVGDTLRATFLTLLSDLPPTAPVLLLATSEVPHTGLPEQVQDLFQTESGELYVVEPPGEDERRAYLQQLLLEQATTPPPKRKQTVSRMLEPLPVAPPPEPRQLSQKELQAIHQFEESIFRELRLFLRDVLTRLAQDKRFKIFCNPVNIEEVPDYLEVIKTPMDLSTMMTKIDKHCYENTSEFMTDLNLVCSNALEYNPDTNPEDKAIRHRACTLRDMAHVIITSELDPEFEKTCEEIKESRARRGNNPLTTAPAYVHTLPKAVSLATPNVSQSTSGTTNYAARRTLGLETPGTGSASRGKKRKRRMKSAWARGSIPSWKKKRKLNNDEDKEAEDAGNEDSNDTVITPTPNGDVQSQDDQTEEDGDSDKESMRSGPVNVPASPRDDHEDSQNSSMLSLESTTEVEMDQSQPSDAVDQSQPSEESDQPPALLGEADQSEPLTVDQSNTSAIEANQSNPTSDEPPTLEPEGSVSPQDGEEETDDKDEDEKDFVVTPRVTRSQTSSLPVQKVEKVLQVLEEPTPDFVVDKEGLEALLEETVQLTGGYSVERLERLHSVMARCIYQYRKVYDRTQLLQDLNGEVHRFCGVPVRKCT
ncbi:PREDICTED: ATPase family AAA domain-containing protein 2-like isoform X1 [Branchiostoma belcheri]|uniref:ATPase family AAA domain-containing protein 2-like isoform X1 n=1 Tax=Branchiostoma belcheri TaxID=7741 RepID=A0A6P5AAR5_BRABE|nr:PREDICTED: ATPase family AAA domain-containing protein 2-like isoform X1 [Branchiostoma belcheri]